MRRIVVGAVIAAACSSNGPQVTATAPQVHATPPEPLSIQTCRAPEPTKLAPGPARIRPPAPGLFGGDLKPRETPARGATCQAARTTLDATNAAILGGKAPAPAAAGKPWDRKTEPARWSRVAQRFGLDERHKAALARDGFVVAGDRTYWAYIEAFHEVFQSELPIYVSIDSVLHAIYASHGGVMADIEQQVLAPRVDALLSTMHCGMATTAKAWPRDIARDVDLYLTVARSLLAGKPVASQLGDDRAAAIVKRINDAKGIEVIELFGRKRIVDFAGFAPRGRYDGRGAAYFRAMMWLSRIELNLVSRGSRSSTLEIDRSETPREVAVALALLELARDTNQLDEIAAIDGAWGELAGKRDDVSFAALELLRRSANIDHVAYDAQPALARAIGKDFKRAMPTQITPDGVTDLPVIAAMFGARTSPDTAALAPIIQPAVPDRFAVGATDIGFVLGHDRAKTHLAGELAKFPTLARQLATARKTLDAKLGGDDMYASWLRAIRALANPTHGVVPSFMKSDAYADLRLNTTIAAYGQLRDSYVLMSGMAYLGSGCEIPDGYVEPAADVYDALIAYAERGKTIVAKLDPNDVSKSAQYFTRLSTTLRVLRAIVATELAGQPLSEAQKKWLSMVVEIVINDGSGALPTYAGWYFDLFRNFSDATTAPDFVTGFAQNLDTVFYAGVSAPRMGVFVVDTGGGPRVVTGPIARTYETTAPTSTGRLNRWTLDDAKITRREPWAASYTVMDGTKPPPIAIEEEWDPAATEDKPRKVWFTATSDTKIDITIEILDHHRVPIAKQTKSVGPGKTLFKFAATVDKVEMIHLQAGNYHAWTERSGDNGFGFWLKPQPEQPNE